MEWEREYDQAIADRIGRRKTMNAAAKRAGATAIPTSLTLHDRLIALDEIGGAVEIEGFPKTSEMRTHFGHACTKYRERAVLTLAMNYTADLSLARRHWPWISLAIANFEDFTEFASSANTSDLTPSQAQALLESISKSAKRLEESLSALRETAFMYRDNQHMRVKGGHLEYLELLIAQGAAGHPSPYVEDDPLKILGTLGLYGNWLAGLQNLIKGAQFANATFSSDLLHSTNRSRIPGLKDFVARLARIWRSLTGRVPSANKVHSPNRPEEPDFVLFVQKVAKLSATAPVPTLSQVASALRT